LSSELSVAQILANLEKQMAFYKEKEAHHAQQEVFHREQRAVNAAELEAVSKHYEAFKATAEGAAAAAARTATVAPPKQQAPAPQAPVTPLRPHKLVARLVKELPAGEAFTASKVAAEVNRRYRSELKKPIDRPTASTCLRRMVADGRVRLVKKGTAHIQAVYTKS
jgi:hypothetical protein